MSSNLPDFLIVGSAKCGTTSLHYYLDQHPEISMPQGIKETFFFIKPKSVMGKKPAKLNIRIIDSYEEYSNLFQISGKTKVTGEATPIYLYFYDYAIPQIKKYAGDPKIIIILRNPAERAYSNYLHHIRDEYESLPFEKVLKKEKERIMENWWYSYRIMDMSLYYNQVKAYLNNFSKVKVFNYEDMKKDNAAFLKEIYNFLEVNPNVKIEKEINRNKTGIPRSRFLQNFIVRQNKIKTVTRNILKNMSPKLEENILKILENLLEKNIRRNQMKKETYNRLIDFFREDILKTQEIINKDLTLWLEKK